MCLIETALMTAMSSCFEEILTNAHFISIHVMKLYNMKGKRSPYISSDICIIAGFETSALRAGWALVKNLSCCRFTRQYF